jgi:hypothetical protein
MGLYRLHCFCEFLTKIEIVKIDPLLPASTARHFFMGMAMVFEREMM